MILQETVEVTISNQEAYYKPLGYFFEKQGDKILVKLEDLPKNSQKKILCKCDDCGIEFTRNYSLLYEQPIHRCRDCSRKYVGILNKNNPNIIHATKLRTGEKHPRWNPNLIRTPPKERTIFELNNPDFNIKEWVLLNCIRKDGRISSQCTKKSWFIKLYSIEVYNAIIEKTNFLPENCTFLERYYCILNDIIEEPKCKICNKPAIFFNTINSGYSDYCSPKCPHVDEELHSIRKEKHNKTIMERYGVTNVSYIPEVKDKISKSSKGRKHINIIHHTRNNFTEEQNYYLDNLDELYNKHINEKIPITTLSKQLGFSNSTLANILKRNGYKTQIFPVKGWNISKAELDIISWIKENDIECISQYKIDKKRIDIFIPEHKLCIEYNGIMFHSYGIHKSSKFNNINEENRNIHVERTKLCNDNGYELLQIFDNEYINSTKRDIWLSTISSKLKLNSTIYARKCTIVELTQNEFDVFVDNNHLQGSVNSKYRYGLMYNNELVSVISFNKSRYSKDYDWEIMRYCNKTFTNVVGGFSRLLKHFRKSFNGSIVSYANRRWSNGNLYEKNGFELVNISTPIYFYFKSSNMLVWYSRNQCMKHKLKDFLEEFDESLSESQNMFMNGYRRIWDCGNLVYVLR